MDPILLKKAVYYNYTLTMHLKDAKESGAPCEKEMFEAIQDLIDGNIDMRAFDDIVQRLLVCSSDRKRRFFYDMYKDVLFAFRQALYLGELVLEGIRPPPQSVAFSSEILNPVARKIQARKNCCDFFGYLRQIYSDHCRDRDSVEWNKKRMARSKQFLEGVLNLPQNRGKSHEVYTEYNKVLPTLEWSKNGEIAYREQFDEMVLNRPEHRDKSHVLWTEYYKLLPTATREEQLARIKNAGL